MKIKHLGETSIEQIVNCFSESFSDYEIKMPNDPSFWKKRWNWARVDYSLSFGAFKGDQLVAFIMIGVDQHEGKLTAFNTGTGVIKNFRGNQLVDKMYAAALPHFQEKGIEKYLLEVLVNNARAIRVYERIGFKIIRRIKCYKGSLSSVSSTDVQIKEIDKEDLPELTAVHNHIYSWDNRLEAILKTNGVYKSYRVYNTQQKAIGYFSMLPSTGYLVQYQASDADFPLLLKGISELATEIKVNNIDSNRTAIIQHFQDAGLVHSVDQFEMECLL